MPVFMNLNMDIEKGSSVALVGESGCGKSTVAKMLLRFIDAESGDITIGGYKLQDYDMKELREHIVYVSQTNFLFTGTIFENLTLHNSNLTLDEVIEACKKVNLHEFINQLPMRYNTLVEENGSNFSGGQRQRLALARALLKDGDIFIFDEVTNQLDPLTEEAVQNVINEISKEKTSIIITHRISNIKHCDKIFLMKHEKGIIAQGSHEELLASCELYKEMCCVQKEVE